MPAEQGPAAPWIQLLTSPGCHLCEAARADLDTVTGPLGLEWEELDVTQDLGLLRRFQEEIPVVLVDGVPRDFWRVDVRRLRALLEERLAGS